MSFASRARSYNSDSDEDLHHDLFVDLLHSAITRNGGTYREVAARAGLSERYLYFVRRKQRPTPTPETLERIICALPGITRREAAALREFARRARSGLLLPSGSMRLVLGDDEVAAEIDRLSRLHHEALHTGSAEHAAGGYQEVQAGVSRLLRSIRDPIADPAAAVRLHLLRCNVASVLDDASSALESARVAQVVLDEHAARTGTADPVLAALRAESLRAEGMALHNLNRDGAALERYRQAEPLLTKFPASQERAYLALSRVRSIVGLRRFRMGDVKGHVDEIRRECERGGFGDREGELLLVRADRALAEAYVRHGDLKPRTKRLLRDQVERLERISLAGPLHRVQIYRTVADFCAARGDVRGRARFLGLAARTAEAARLEHQLRGLRDTIEREG